MSTERPTKRSRVSRACDQCRTAREKCDGTQPTCLTCLSSKRSCTYTAAPKKRGIQPGYIRTLELALTWLFQQNPESEAVLNKKLAREGISSILLSRDSKESNRLHKSWRRSKFCKDVDKLLSGEQIRPGDDASPASDDEESDPEGDYTGLQSQLPLFPSQEHASPSAFFTSPQITQPTRPSLDLYRATDANSPRNTQPPGVTSLPTGSWRLLDVYFAYTQSWLPICEKHDLLRVSYSYPDEGMALSITTPDCGDHAELWSVLVVAAYQARLERPETEAQPDIEWMYGITRGLIPTESGSFHIGHVKAILNLAVVNIGLGKPEVAWLLVGSASRLIIVIERSMQLPSPRWKHVVAGCYLLDTFLSLQLRGRPHLRRLNINAIEEDGLEEWQPWTCPLNHSSVPPSRIPVLGLSSFNKLLDLAGALGSSTLEQTAMSEQSTRQLLSQLNFWKASLPAKFDYIIDDRKATPPNPPALLLQLTYICSLFTSNGSQAHVESTIHLLERFRDQLGLSALPPVILCLLEYMQMSRAYGTTEQQLQARLQNLIAEIKYSWSLILPTPESIQAPFSTFTPLSNRPPSGPHRATTSLLEDLLPDMHPAASTESATVTHHNFSLPSLLANENGYRKPSLHHRNSTAPHELEMFFDELASLDGAEKLDNQPQFMKNLGFAPDANMSDFLAAEFGQFLPANPGAFMPQNSDDPTQLDPAFFGAT
ncbi:hypothetical protein K458DRAFT_361723 [Lentithecium fluviatile CBS 122367]|uniref:Zn(2)-C6 fungal-type domain-containing protein n=1 Tax=Lentithecium fluviatile CBS 122367 TaxID=1168545 RepID=A0A6G1J9G2_9PLEO|nr:hypothetical protein K458DRAFT_361723 [Lentithecium fluviatile CBS 122367]